MEITYNYFDNSDAHLPPGFRFHPTDEELITYYLLKKVLDCNFTGRAIAEVDLNKCEPWELPAKAKMGEKEWYFFSLRDRKYPTGLRTNRATEAGYWKATGKDREIYSSKTCALVGMKKTLVFYRGRAPKGEKSNWVMHEYRLEGKFAYQYLSRSSKDEWVISRVFQKSSGAIATAAAVANAVKKSRLSCTISSSSTFNHSYPEPSSPSSVSLPPLLDHPTIAAAANATTAPNDSCSYDESHAPSDQHVSCFSTIAAAAAAASAATTTTFNTSSSAFDFTTVPAPVINAAAGAGAACDPFARFGRNNVGLNAFPNLRSLQENLQLPFFFATPASSVAPPPFQGGGGGSNWSTVMQDIGGGGGGGVVGGGGRLNVGPTELDCMWTY
ncbi:hypothetical protein AB3S75_019715 [Citrus x aurantiifolia]